MGYDVSVSQFFLGAELLRIANYFRTRLLAYTPVRSGYMAMTCKIWGELVLSNYASVNVGWRKIDFLNHGNGRMYPIYVEKGTGRFVNRAFLTPKPPNKFLRFVNEEGTVIFTRRVKGQKGQHMVDRALAEMKVIQAGYFGLYGWKIKFTSLLEM